MPSAAAANWRKEQLAIVSTVCTATRLPVAVKLSPSYTNLAHFARRLHQAGARGLVLFNRFFQPDIDIEALEHVSNVLLSSAADLRPPLRWIALLEGQVPLDFAASGGVAHGTDVVRLLMVGASVTMVVSDLLRHGPVSCGSWKRAHWLARTAQLRLRAGLAGLHEPAALPRPGRFERAQYVRAISTSPAGSALGTHL